MNDDEHRVAGFLKEYNLIAVEFTKKERKQLKTPDFRVLKDDELVFYCEVKSIDKDDFDELVLERGFYIRTGKDPIDDIISTKIHKAHKQFNAANKNCDLPNVLIFINHERTYAWEIWWLTPSSC